MTEFIDVMKALSDESRVRILMFLGNRELCLCQVIDVLGLAPSTISKHLSVLHRAGLIQRRKEGRWHYYRLSDGKGSRLVRSALKLAKESLEETTEVKKDSVKIGKVLKKDLAKLCLIYKN
jgi:ArsR family transcriptional regulator, arsenate/arsenite/antimonite-responsive transcriptional repressor